MSGGLEVELAGRQVRISNPSKVFFADAGMSKIDVVRYYETIAEPLLASIGNRPLLLERHPDGAGGKSFFQKRARGGPEWLTTTKVKTVNGTPSDALVAADIAHVAWAVNMGCLGFHVWPFDADDTSVSDELRFDLDPTPAATFDHVKTAAIRVRSLLTDCGMTGYIKTTGKSGLHVLVRLQRSYDSVTVRAAAVAAARELERRYPAEITAAWWREERDAPVFIDFNQNAPHKTLFAAWCLRALPYAPVSCPIRWEELDEVFPDQLTAVEVVRRYRTNGDPWEPMYSHRHSLAPLLKLHEADIARGLPDAPWPPQYPKMPREARRVAPSRIASWSESRET